MRTRRHAGLLSTQRDTHRVSAVLFARGVPLLPRWFTWWWLEVRMGDGPLTSHSPRDVLFPSPLARSARNQARLYGHTVAHNEAPLIKFVEGRVSGTREDPRLEAERVCKGEHVHGAEVDEATRPTSARLRHVHIQR